MIKVPARPRFKKNSLMRQKPISTTFTSMETAILNGEEIMFNTENAPTIIIQKIISLTNDIIKIKKAIRKNNTNR